MSEQKVVGVSFDSDDVAPVVMLKAAGSEAQSVLGQALRDDVPVVHDPELVKQLYRIPMDRPIGRELFPVMAVLLAHVLRVDQEPELIRDKRETL